MMIQGDWKNGKKHGRGELSYANGDKFSGHWMEDKACGSGMLEQSNGDIYEGEWLDDNRHGFGKFTSKSTGVMYEGMWNNGIKVKHPLVLSNNDDNDNDD